MLRMHTKRVSKDFEIKIQVNVNDFYPKGDAVLLADVFRKMCLEIYELDSVKFLSAPGLAQQVALKKNKVKLELLTKINILLMVNKGVRGEYIMLFPDM